MTPTVQRTIRFNLSEQEDNFLTKEANHLEFEGVNEYIRASTGLLVGADRKAMRTLFGLAKKLQTTPARVLSGIVARWAADGEAHDLVFGKQTRVLTEFATTSDGPIKEKVLFDTLKAERVHEYEVIQRHGKKVSKRNEKQNEAT